MEKYRDKYRIPSARASWWDYSANACYFITICTANRECLFGQIKTQEHMETNGHLKTHRPVETHSRASLQGDEVFVELSSIGNIVDDEWNKSFIIREELFCDAFVIMPNHVHAVLRIDNDIPSIETHGCASMTGRAFQNNDASLPEPKRSIKSISSFVGGFKSSATRQINIYRNMPGVPVWQTRFYDRIIRNAHEYRRIINYIIENPLKWQEDDLYEPNL